MNLLNELWNDEAGSVVSAELVLLGTLGVVGVGVGAAAIGDSADLEMEELAYSLRSADQSYRVHGFRGCGAWTAGSFYTQPPVEESLAALREQARRDRAALEERLRAAEDRGRDRDEERREDEFRLERRRRMREREREQRDEQRNERWDGNERPRFDDDTRAPDRAEDEAL